MCQTIEQFRIVEGLILKGDLRLYETSSEILEYSEIDACYFHAARAVQQR